MLRSNYFRMNLKDKWPEESFDNASAIVQCVPIQGQANILKEILLKLLHKLNARKR